MGRLQFVGLDVHKDTIDPSVVGDYSAVPEVEKPSANRPALVKRQVNDLNGRGSVVAAYEAGCISFELQRMLNGLGGIAEVRGGHMVGRHPFQLEDIARAGEGWIVNRSRYCSTCTKSVFA